MGFFQRLKQGLTKTRGGLTEKVEELVQKLQKDPNLLEKFRSNPVSVVEELVGMDLPDDQIKQMAELIKAKIDLDKVGNLLGGLFKK